MIGHSNIMGTKEQETFAVLFWDTKGRKKQKYRIKSLRVYLNERNLNNLNETTRMKAELLLSEIYRLIKIKRVRSELDLEVFINGFMREHNPAMLHNGKKHFSYRHTPNENCVLRTTLESEGFVLADDRYYKRKFNKLRKELMKDVINEVDVEASDE